MRGFSCLFLIAFVVVCVSADFSQYAKFIDECKKEQKIENLSRDHPQFKCFLACILKAIGVMKDGKIIEDELFKHLKDNNYDESKTDQIRATITEANKKTNECEMAEVVVKGVRPHIPSMSGKKSE